MTPSQPVSDADFAYVQRLLREYAGSVLEADKHYLVDTRLSPVVMRLELASVDELISRLRAQPFGELHRATIEAMLNGETTFFRDVFFFDALRDVILPRLIASRAAERRIHIWCAACSTGQEPYSVAMLLAESFPELADWSVSILATDVSETHLARARAGRYAQFEANRGLPASLLVKYFDQEGTEWIIDPAMRRRVEFRELNLVQPWPFVPQADLILLRNVMIYWDIEAKREVLARMRDVLRSDGCLVLGAAETTYYVDDAFDRVSADTACCFRLKEPLRSSRR
jgi:chemotaxis protein methyltransferase CheR